MLRWYGVEEALPPSLATNVTSYVPVFENVCVVVGPLVSAVVPSSKPQWYDVTAVSLSVVPLPSNVIDVFVVVHCGLAVKNACGGQLAMTVTFCAGPVPVAFVVSRTVTVTPYVPGF